MKLFDPEPMIDLASSLFAVGTVSFLPPDLTLLHPVNAHNTSMIHNTIIDSTVTMDFGIMAAIATIYVYNLTVKNYTTGVNIGNGGVVGFNGGNYAISDVTNRYSQSKNTVGVGILYGAVNETIV